jgi:ParB-like chromosome segregation protein Spo0J
MSALDIGVIDVGNPRARNRRIFKEIVTSVAELGLKRPITVKRKDGDGETRFDLVCGQGLCVPKTLNPTVMVMKSAQDGT